MVVNALGDVYDWKTGRQIAGLLTEDRLGLRSTSEQMKASIEKVENKFTGNTTLAVVITNAAFDKAQQGYAGVGFTPIALLGTQVVAGTNYKFLCDGTAAVQNPAAELYVVTVYEDPSGNAEISSAEAFDLLYYIGN